MTDDWAGWCDGSAHAPWYVFEGYAGDHIVRTVARDFGEARTQIEAMLRAFYKTHGIKSRARIQIDRHSHPRCWRYRGQPDPHIGLDPAVRPVGERMGVIV